MFNPSNLDTDQWMETASKMGAKYAVLVANHCSGFCLWPTKDYDYSIKNTPYKDGKGDIVGEFIESCKKFGLRPGLYYSTICNAHELFDQPGNQTPEIGTEKFNSYCDLVEKQVTELWTQYGDIFEIWFDGGNIKGGPDIASLLKKYQPKAVCFQGPSDHPSNLRWVGNEKGVAPYPCWSTISDVGHYDGTKEVENMGGDPDGNTWMPAETDTPNRQLQWFWYENQDDLVKSSAELVRAYYTSVGRNTNLLLGMVIDNRGLVPEKDKQEFLKFGKEIKERFAKPLARTKGKGQELQITLGKQETINQIVIQEEIEHGERIRDYIIEGKINNEWKVLCKGSSVGHKRIELISSIEVSQVRLKIINSTNTPLIRNFELYKVNPLPKKLSLLKKLKRMIKISKNIGTILS